MTFVVALVLSAQPTAVWVVVDPELHSSEAFGDRYQLSADPSLRRVAEGGRLASNEEVARERLAAISGPLRRFDFTGAALAVERAWEAVSHLAPTTEGRALVLELCAAHAQLAVLTNDAPLLQQVAGWALTVDPSWEPDAQKVPPQVRQRLLEVMRTVPKSPVTRTLRPSPKDAKAMVAGVEVGAGPFEAPAAGALVWVTAEGHLPTLLKAGPKDVEVTLAPRTMADRAAPLVAAIRAAQGPARVTAARALGVLLSVDVVLVDERGVTSVVEVREPTAPPSRFLDGFGIGLGVAAGLFAGGAAVLFGLGETSAREAAMATTLEQYASAAVRARDLRVAATVGVVAAGLASVGALLRFLWVGRASDVPITLGADGLVVRFSSL